MERHNPKHSNAILVSIILSENIYDIFNKLLQVGMQFTDTTDAVLLLLEKNNHRTILLLVEKIPMTIDVNRVLTTVMSNSNYHKGLDNIQSLLNTMLLRSNNLDFKEILQVYKMNKNRCPNYKKTIFNAMKNTKDYEIIIILETSDNISNILEKINELDVIGATLCMSRAYSIAVNKGMLDVVKHLTKHVQKGNFTKRINKCLEIAVKNKDISMIDYFCSMGADRNIGIRVSMELNDKDLVSKFLDEYTDCISLVIIWSTMKHHMDILQKAVQLVNFNNEKTDSKMIAEFINKC